MFFWQAQNEAKEREVKEREENLKRLMNAADLDLVPNDEAFECPICFCDVEPGEGVRLRECLHQFCKSDVALCYPCTHRSDQLTLSGSALRSTFATAKILIFVVLSLMISISATNL